VKTTRRVTKREPTEHESKWERLEEYKIGRRTLRPGQVVKITNERGAHFEFLYAERHTETEQVNLTFVGGRHGHRMFRSFKPERVKQFVYMAR
jgi:hypothetical protein